MPPKHSTESENTKDWDCIIRTALSRRRNDLFYIGWFHSIVDKPAISWWSLINLSVVRNNCHTWTAPRSVTDMNIPHVAVFTSRSFKSSGGLRPYLGLTIEKTSPCAARNLLKYGDCVANLRHLPSVPKFPGYPGATNFPVLAESSGRFRCSWSSSIETGFPVLASRNASICHPWELDGASWLRSLASGFPVLDQPVRQGALTIPGLFDAFGLFSHVKSSSEKEAAGMGYWKTKVR